MIRNTDANIRLGDFNSPAFCLIGAICSRTRVHNFTADFPCDVGGVMRGANCGHENKYKLILAAPLAAKSYVSLLNEKR